MAVTGDLVDVMASCPTCAAAGGECVFHAGFGEGWDAAVAFMASHLEAERAAELDAGDELVGEVVEGRR
jgi:hypothetical protein